MTGSRVSAADTALCLLPGSLEETLLMRGGLRADPSSPRCVRQDKDTASEARRSVELDVHYAADRVNWFRGRTVAAW